MADSVSLFDKKWVLVNKNFVQSRVGPMIVERLYELPKKVKAV